MAYEYWLSELSLLAPKTQRNYKHYFNMYLEYAKQSPDELYQWQKRLLDDGDPRTNREVALNVAHCIRDLVEGEYQPNPDVDRLSSGTAAIVASSVRSFMKANGLVFPLSNRDIPKVNSNGSRVIMLDEIKQLWDVVGNELKDRNRALLMVLKDTGLRVSDVVSLTCEMYYGSRVIETQQGTFRVLDQYTTIKTSEPAYIHLGPESCESVEVYLAGRRNGPLFLDRGGEPMSDEALTMLIRRTVSRLENMHKVSAHSFRKTHRTLLESRIPESYVKKLQGKSTDPYIHPEQTGELTKAYLENYDVLRVFKEKQELETVKQELTEYKTETDVIRINQQSAIAALKAEVEQVRREREEFTSRVLRELEELKKA